VRWVWQWVYLWHMVKASGFTGRRQAMGKRERLQQRERPQQRSL